MTELDDKKSDDINSNDENVNSVVDSDGYDQIIVDFVKAVQKEITDTNVYISDETRFKSPNQNANETVIKPTDLNKTVIKNVNKTKNEFKDKDHKFHDHSYSIDIQDSGHHGVLKERFILTKIIGTGGMGVVYKAKDLLKVEAKDSDPYIAIKVLSEEFKKHPDAFISLQRESRKSQRIAHPNIVNVYDFDRDGETVFMTMEFMEGKSLEQLIRKYNSNGLPREKAWKILKSVSYGLIHAHSENIIHSDLKPGNIFVTKNNITKVFDFGIARAVAKVPHNNGSTNDKTKFDAGNLGALTPTYASLEMLNGETPDYRDDIYALGCVAYEILTGKHPFNKVSADEAQKQGLTPKKISNISKRQWQAIESALAFKRQDRIKTVKEFLNKIDTDNKRNYTIPLIVLLMIMVFGLFQYSQNNNTGITELEIRKKIEYEIQLESSKIVIESLLTTAEFSSNWEAKLWNEYQVLEKNLEITDTFYRKEEITEIKENYAGLRKKIVELYLNEISDARESGHYIKTKELIQTTTRYTQNNQESMFDLIRAIEIEKQRLTTEQINEITTATQSEPQIEKTENETEQSSMTPIPHELSMGNQINNSLEAILNQKKNEFFNLTLEKVNIQLRCQSTINMNDLHINIRKLNSFNSKKYINLKPGIINKLVMCIMDVAKSNPKKALKYKKSALMIFKINKTLSAIEIIF